MKFLFLISLFHLSAFAQFETPKDSKTELLQESDFVEDERLKLNCKIYDNYVLAEKVEPGFVGNSIFTKAIKSLKKDEKLKQCDNVDLDSFKKVETEGMIVWGLKDRYLFLKDADELSARTKFEIFNIETGTLVYQGARNNDLLFKVTSVGNHILALEYFQKYAVNCDFTEEKAGAKCWKDFLRSIQPNALEEEQIKKLKPAEAAKVEKFVSLPVPQCPEDKNKKKFQVYLKIQIPNIDKAKRKILYSKPNCELAP